MQMSITLFFFFYLFLYIFFFNDTATTEIYTLSLHDALPICWQSDPNPYYQMADIFICPSRIEPLGNVILEAWSHGLPVIATRSAGAEELIHDGVDGRLVPIDDPATLAAAIRGFLETDTKTLEAFAEAGRVTLAENHGAESVLARYIEMYRLLSKDN